MEEENIPVLCFLTADFLIRFENNKNNPHFVEVHRDFLQHMQSEPKRNDFQYMNYGAVVMLCYGLLVYPIELWKHIVSDDLNMKRLEKSIINAASEKGVKINSFRDLFNINIPQKPPVSEDFLRMLRNAISHAHIKIDFANDLYIFWNDNKANKTNFKVSIGTNNLNIFLTGHVRYFGGARRPALPS